VFLSLAVAAVRSRLGTTRTSSGLVQALLTVALRWLITDLWWLAVTSRVYPGCTKWCGQCSPAAAGVARNRVAVAALLYKCAIQKEDHLWQEQEMLREA
jgi:hypothetical protein